MTESTDNTTSSGFSRRAFIGGAAGAAVAAGVLGDLPEGMAEAMAAPRQRGRLADIEHVVVLMQENRSFDHYYGTMRGVRGFGDKAALTLGTGKDVFHQPDSARTDGGYLLPFHVDTTKVDGQDLADLDHSWGGTHQAVNGGAQAGWVGAKGEETMAYFTATDLPFHRALAGAYTICDHYFCSIQGPTTPNRLYHWTGMIDPMGTQGGPATWNPDDYNPVYRWTTYPERLQVAGVSWQVYANNEVGDGDDGYVGDYGDNPLWLFQAYHDALASSDPKVRQLAERANVALPWQADSGQGENVDHVLAQFISACQSGQLPQVSWVVAPYRYSEHPAARPIDGAAYTQAMLTALWQNPKLWESTVVLINYDENDGFFDHAVSPLPPAGTAAEFLPVNQLTTAGNLGTGPLAPIGLGPRVPMTVVSPWSRGGFVNSQVFDHTSVLQFLEQWTGVRETNISAWRRAVCGDLTSCFDFTTRTTSVPTLPDTNALRTQADQRDPNLPTPTPPVTGAQVTPTQEPGTAPARPLPYQPTANTSIGSSVNLAFTNQGSQAMNFAVYANHLAGAAPTHTDVSPYGRASSTVPLGSSGAYNVAVHSANGFLFTASGDQSSTAAGVEVTASIIGLGNRPVLLLEAQANGRQGATVHIRTFGGTPWSAVDDQGNPIVGGPQAAGQGVPPQVRNGTGGTHTLRLRGGQRQEIILDPIDTNHGWYDLSVTADGLAAFGRRFAGHLENGRTSRTG